MINYFKYLPVSREDEQWGLSVLNAGCTHIEPAHQYPMQTHPRHHYFQWSNWRVLDEYQIIYITKGKGVFESENQELAEVQAGTLILLFPGERHRYRPDAQTGWDEYWVGVRGKIMDDLRANGYICPRQPCLPIGFHEQIFNLFDHIIGNTKTEKPGYQPLISGAVLHLLGHCHSVSRQMANENSGENILIDKARLLFREHLHEHYSPEQAAAELHIGYSKFRKIFKAYTGLSPGQYYLQLKIRKAKEMLGDPDLPVKEIAYRLRFDSCFYFSKIFREKAGLSPTEYRKRNLCDFSVTE
ncbi:MAG: AraC family transcriptional regulator [Mucilaginibacter polytrichastri]|nr:AraC family transcriptional regulator [Mucilaginibacter polytrichastri]